MKAYLIAALLLLIPASTAVAAVQPADFAYGIPLSLEEKGAVYRLEVPVDVYQTVTRSDLGDLRVFNKAKAAVPFMLRRPNQENEIHETKKPLPIFPFYRKRNRSGKENLSVHFEKKADGTIIDIRSNNGAMGQERNLIGYIIDASAHDERMDALDIIWQRPPKSFVTEISVERSADLTRWTPLVSRTTLARMNFKGHQIIKERVILPSKSNTYIRMLWPQGRDGIEVKSILAVQRRGEPARDRQWKTLEGEMVDVPGAPAKAITAYEYDSGAKLPVDRIRLRFVEKNTLLEVSLFSRSHRESEWRFRQKGLLYDLDFANTALVQDTVSLREINDRYWRLEIAKDALGDPHNIPTVDLGWLPHDLLFVARGEGPFMMAYGSARIEEGINGNGSAAPLDQIVRGNEQDLLKDAIALPRTVLGGPDRLLPAPPPLPWRKWLLWGVLVVGVGLIAWMALSLGKGMAKDKT